MTTLNALESRDLYTVGWIAALPIELAAATAMLDEEHKKPLDFAQPPSDKNSYTWGRIGEHNVVVASLPAGVYGTTSATTTASHMLSSFPQIRVGLMVGIGAAIARPERGHDIRLGDVVVSQPDGRSGGVVQYDLRKAKEGHGFERKGILNMPPEALLKALAKLQAQHEMGLSKIPELLKEMVKRKPQMAKSKPGKPGYAYQGKENDRLFKAIYPHIDGFECSNCDTEGELARDNRDSNEPEVHYGIIASGNTLVKDAAIRDSIVKETGEECICVEMEAAGLMNSFPCLVIRGICDYADSHKNDRWQRYAAATAAAYAKDFLGVVPGEDLQKMRKAAEIAEIAEIVKDSQFTSSILQILLITMRVVAKDITNIHSTTEETRSSVDRLHLDYHQREIIKWLSAPDPSTNYNKALEQRYEGSGLWFLESDAFAKWKTRRNSFLWLHGIPGCGKTILSSAIIKNLDSNLASQPLLYFYFDFNDSNKQTLKSMLSSLISQFCYKRVETLQQLDSLFSSCEDGRRQLTSESLCKTLLDMIGQVKEVWLVLDALDECSTRKGKSTEGLLSWIREVLHSEQRNVHLLMTSRPEQDIESGIMEFAHNDDIMPIQSSLIGDDIRAYIRTRVREDNGLKRWRLQPEIQNEIETWLMEKADGM